MTEPPSRTPQLRRLWRRPPKSGPRTPLVVLLHGRGADEHDLLGIADELPRAFMYVSVRAPVSLEGGGYTWFENRGIARPLPGSIRASVSLLRAWLDSADVANVSERCYLLGFSAGMMMAGALLLDDPQRFAGAVLLSGALAIEHSDPSRVRPLAAKPVFYARGIFDDVIPAPLVAATETYLRKDSGADLTVKLYRHAHSIARGELDDIAAWFGERE